MFSPISFDEGYWIAILKFIDLSWFVRGSQFIEYYAIAPHINRLVKQLSFTNLGSHVTKSPFMLICPNVAVNFHGKTEVNDLKSKKLTIPCWLCYQVFYLYVCMDYPFLMDVVQTLQNIPTVAEQLFRVANRVCPFKNFFSKVVLHVTVFQIELKISICFPICIQFYYIIVIWHHLVDFSFLFCISPSFICLKQLFSYHFFDNSLGNK